MSKILKIAPKYAEFFVRNTDERWLLIQGGRRSGKSIAVYKWITLLASAEVLKVYVVAATYPAAMLAVQDFELATGLSVTGSAVHGYNCTLQNGSVIAFKAFDTPTKAQGTSADIVVLEEALNIDEQVVNVLSLSVRKQLIAIYNPTRESYLEKYRNDSNFLKTTWKDNIFLGEAQKAEFEGIRERAMSTTASVLDLYNYKVYYLGDFSEMGGKVFREIYTCTDEFFEELDTYAVYGIDFGFVDGGDSTSVVKCKINNNCLYLKEILNDRYLSKAVDLGYKLRNEHSVSNLDYLVCDYGGLGKEKIKELAELDFNVQNAIKGKVVDGLQTMLQFDKIICTESSRNLRQELADYELNAEGREVGKHQNLVDASRYAAVFLKKKILYI